MSSYFSAPLLAFLLLTAAVVRAGDLQGQLKDSVNGTLIVDAQLICLCTESGVRKMTRSDSQGHYHLKNLPAGTYWLAVSHSSYHASRQENLVLESTGNLEQHFQLDPLAADENTLMPIQEVAGEGELTRSDQKSAGSGKTPKSKGLRDEVRSVKNSLKLKLTEMFLKMVGGLPED